MISSNRSSPYKDPRLTIRIDYRLVYCLLSDYRVGKHCSDAKINEILEPVYAHIGEKFKLRPGDTEYPTPERVRNLIDGKLYRRYKGSGIIENELKKWEIPRR